MKRRFRKSWSVGRSNCRTCATPSRRRRFLICRKFSVAWSSPSASTRYIDLHLQLKLMILKFRFDAKSFEPFKSKFKLESSSVFYLTWVQCSWNWPYTGILCFVFVSHLFWHHWNCIFAWLGRNCSSVWRLSSIYGFRVYIIWCYLWIFIFFNVFLLHCEVVCKM